MPKEPIVYPPAPSLAFAPTMRDALFTEHIADQLKPTFTLIRVAEAVVRAAMIPLYVEVIGTKPRAKRRALFDKMKKSTCFIVPPTSGGEAEWVNRQLQVERERLFGEIEAVLVSRGVLDPSDDAQPVA